MDNFLVEALDEALTKFGTYSYYDKGPGEVMDVQPLIDRLENMPISDCANLMLDLKNHEHGVPLYACLFTDLVENGEDNDRADILDTLL